MPITDKNWPALGRYESTFVSHFVTKLTWHCVLQIAGHSILAAILWSCARSVDLTSKAAITSFYMFIWKVIPLSLYISSLPCGVVGAMYCPVQLNYLSRSAPPLNPGTVHRVDQLLTIYSPTWLRSCSTRSTCSSLWCGEREARWWQTDRRRRGGKQLHGRT